MNRMHVVVVNDKLLLFKTILRHLFALMIFSISITHHPSPNRPMHVNFIYLFIFLAMMTVVEPLLLSSFFPLSPSSVSLEVSASLTLLIKSEALLKIHQRAPTKPILC